MFCLYHVCVWYIQYPVEGIKSMCMLGIKAGSSGKAAGALDYSIGSPGTYPWVTPHPACSSVGFKDRTYVLMLACKYFINRTIFSAFHF